MSRLLVALVAVCLLAACDADRLQEADALNFHAALAASNEALRTTNRVIVRGGTATEAENEAILRQVRIALEHARQVRGRTLERMHEDMPRVFHDRFIRGLETVERAMVERNPALLAEGHLHLDRWADWLEAHLREIRFPPRPAALDQDAG